MIFASSIYVTKKHPGGWILVRNRANHIRACSIYNQCHWFWLTQSYVLPDRGKKTISRNDCGFYCYKKKQCYGVALLLFIYIWAWNLKGNPKKSISQCWPFWPQQGGLLYLLVLKIWFDWQYCCRIYNIQEKKTMSPILMYWIF